MIIKIDQAATPDRLEQSPESIKVVRAKVARLNLSEFFWSIAAHWRQVGISKHGAQWVELIT
jgi:hypothetical protein